MKSPNFIQLLLFILCLNGVFTSVQAETNQLEKPKKPLVILISLDGFKPDYLNRGLTPTLNQLAQNGVLAKGLISSFPSVTFPNHYTIVTGLTPDHNGIVNNKMYDPEIPNQIFTLSSRASVTNAKWWQQATPIWVTARQQGKITSTLFWPGSEALNHGLQPNDWLPYDGQMNSMERVEKLLQWLDRPDEKRADFATLYFSEVDHFGHETGPNGVGVNNAIKRVDDALSALLEGLEKLKLIDRTTLIVVSDHGMAEVGDNKIINLKTLLKEQPQAKIRWTGAFGGIDADNKYIKPILKTLNGQRHMNCWEKENMPARFGYGTNKRIPAIFCLAEEGWFITDKTKGSLPLGMHGYDPALQDMQGLFIASGYKIKHKNSELAPFKNVDIYPLLTQLLGIKGLSGDGDDHLLELIKP